MNRVVARDYVEGVPEHSTKKFFKIIRLVLLFELLLSAI